MSIVAEVMLLPALLAGLYLVQEDPSARVPGQAWQTQSWMDSEPTTSQSQMPGSCAVVPNILLLTSKRHC